MDSSLAFPKLPRGYRGIGHEVIGSDLLSLVEAVPSPEQIFGEERAAELRVIDPAAWYPYARLSEATRLIEEQLGSKFMRRLGIALFNLTHAELARATANSAKDVLSSFNEMYHAANRGIDIGGWELAAFGPGTATLIKTTPHNCQMEEGIMEAALRVPQAAATIVQRECLRRGNDVCIFELTSEIKDARWMGTGPA